MTINCKQPFLESCGFLDCSALIAPAPSQDSGAERGLPHPQPNHSTRPKFISSPILPQLAPSTDPSPNPYHSYMISDMEQYGDNSSFTRGLKSPLWIECTFKLFFLDHVAIVLLSISHFVFICFPI